MRAEEQQLEDGRGADDAGAMPVNYRLGGHLWTPYYVVLWLHAVALAAVIHLPAEAPHRGLWRWIAWIVLLGAVAALGRAQRTVLHDLLTTLSHRERVALMFLAGGVFLSPSIFENWRILPHGFLWLAVPMLAFAVTPSLAYRFLAVTLAGGWCAAYWVRGPLEVPLLLVFALSWLTALGLVRIAFLGDRHGLHGWAPLDHQFGATLWVALPATVAAVLTWIVWPRGGLVHWTPPVTGAADRPQRLASRISELDMMELFWNCVLFALSLAGLIVLLYFLRRWLLRVRGGGAPGELLAGQSATLEYRAEPPAPPAPALGGLRGQVVRLWGRWAAAMGVEGAERQPGETADEFARRLGLELPDGAPPAEMTRLLDRAHYSDEAIDRQDVARMRQWVQDELNRQSLRREAPTEPIE